MTDVLKFTDLYFAHCAAISIVIRMLFFLLSCDSTKPMNVFIVSSISHS